MNFVMPWNVRKKQQGEAYLQFAPNVARPPKEEGEGTVVRRM